jgi:hypothetical protein
MLKGIDHDFRSDPYSNKNPNSTTRMNLQRQSICKRDDIERRKPLELSKGDSGRG